MSTPTNEYVVVGVDGSEPSEHALRWAAFMARQTGAELRAISAWSPVLSGGGAVSPDDWDPRGDAEEILATTVAKVLGDAPDVVQRVVEGGAAKTLLDESAGARMLVVGSRGHGGFAGLLLGSVSTVCAAHATCPVLIIHGDTPLPEVTRAGGHESGKPEVSGTIAP